MNENATVVTEQVETTEIFEETTDNAQTTETTVAVEETPVAEEHSAEEAPATDVPENFEDTHTDAVEQPTTFSSTYREKREAIDNALPHIHETDDDGVVHDVYFWICDFDDTHVFVEKCEYTRDAGYTEVKGRYAYTFDDANKTATVSGDFEEMFVKWLTKDELDQLEAQRAQYEELVQYKAQREKTDFEDSIDLALGEFEDLEGNDAFTAIVEKKYTYESVEALKDACYIVRGKFSAPVKHPKTSGEPTVPVGAKPENTPNIYDEFFARYGKRK